MRNKRGPKMRFSGFKGEWEERKIGGISEKVTEKNHDNDYSETLTNSAEFGIITQRDFFEKDISNEKNLNSYHIVKPDYFVYNPRISKFAPVGPIKRNKLGRTGVMSPLYYVFRTHDVDKTYLEYYFSSNNWHRFMILNGDSGARSDRFAIKDSVFREMPIPIPSGEEQLKIGNYFKRIDETIEIHEQELTILKQTKQGFLQKMFPKEGESVPEIRFPGFTGDWEQRKLSDITNVITKGTTPKDKNSNGNINFIKVESINPSSGTISYPSKISEDEHEGYLKRSQLESDDILFSIAGTLGRVTIINDDVLPANTNQALAIIRLSEGNVEFIATYLKGKSVEDYIRKNPTVGAQPNLSLQQTGNLTINCPNIREQEKIGFFFKQLDDTIALHEQELETLKQTKKAFLQKMFV